MNLDRAIYGRITIGTHKQTLGRSDWSTIMLRATEVYRMQKNHGGDINTILELSTAPLPDTSILSREQQLEHEFNNLLSQSDPNEIMDHLPNGTPLTLKEIGDAFIDPIFERYYHVCDPKNRVGMDQAVIDAARFEFDSKYPGWREINRPGWIDS